MTAPTNKATNEQDELRAIIHKRLTEINQSYAGYINSGVKDLWPPMFKQIEDYIVSTVSHHTEEAERCARIAMIDQVRVISTAKPYEGQMDFLNKCLDGYRAELASTNQPKVQINGGGDEGLI